jgi:hypothetical protein
MANIDSGITIYDVNKQGMAGFSKLSKKNLEVAIFKLRKYAEKTNNRFYMLLCNDRRDFTIFRLKEKELKNRINMIEDLKECLQNRGDIIDINEDENGGMEIWLKIDKEAFAYYFFPYDAAVIES